MSNKRYPEEFKIEAVKQVTERGPQPLTLRNGSGYLSRRCTNG